MNSEVPLFIWTILLCGVISMLGFLDSISTLFGSAVGCVGYDSASSTIIVSCKAADLTQVTTRLNNEALLKRETKGDWFLNANLVVRPGATLYINSTDTSWLKINSTNPVKAYNILISGSLYVDSVKITSWNTDTNDYVYLSPGNTMLARPSIIIEAEATGESSIKNSEIAYMGYEGIRRAGLNYYGGHGSEIIGNNIHHLWRGFYSKDVRDLLIQNNHVHDNHDYGIDPHSGTRDSIIRSNIVHDNGGQGIICSLNCYNITFEGNKVYQNKGSGIMFSRGMENSIARNNDISHESECIFVSDSSNNRVYNNTVSSCENGIYLKAGSLENIIENNTIRDSDEGILVNTESSNNIIKNNSIRNSGEFGIIVEDADSADNAFDGNHITNSAIAIGISDNADTIFKNNTILLTKNHSYSLTEQSELHLEGTNFLRDSIASLDEEDDKKVTISKSGIVSVIRGVEGESRFRDYDTDLEPYEYEFEENEHIVVHTR